MKKRDWTVSLTLFFLIAGSVPANAESDFKTEKFVYNGESGTVVFLHKKHSERNIGDCGFCHSALRTFGGIVDQLYGHNVCLKCHEDRKGPTACEQCHADYKEL